MPLGLLAAPESAPEPFGRLATGSAAVSIPVTVVAVFILTASGYVRGTRGGQKAIRVWTKYNKNTRLCGK